MLSSLEIREGNTRYLDTNTFSLSLGLITQELEIQMVT